MGQLEALQWAREHGCPWDEDVCAWLLRGHLHVLKWAWEHDCPCDERKLCAWAAQVGHLEMLV